MEVSGSLTAVQTVPGTAVLGAAEPEETLTLDSVVFPKHFTVVMHFLILLYVDHGTPRNEGNPRAQYLRVHAIANL